MPFLAMYADGTVSSMPGDNVYPDTVELIASKPVRAYGQTMDWIRNRSKSLNRLEIRGSECDVVVNIDMPLGHIRPVPHQHITDQFTCAKLWYFYYLGLFISQ